MYDEYFFPASGVAAPARSAATVSFKSVTRRSFFHPRTSSVFLSVSPMRQPTTSGAFTSFVNLMRMPSPSSVISIGYEKQKPIDSALSFKCSMFDAISSKNSARESVFATPGIFVFSRKSIDAFPCSLNDTRQERKFVPPASMTMTLLSEAGFSGGLLYVRIIS